LHATSGSNAHKTHFMHRAGGVTVPLHWAGLVENPKGLVGLPGRSEREWPSSNVTDDALFGGTVSLNLAAQSD
jgi:hypothetical protein